MQCGFLHVTLAYTRARRRRFNPSPWLLRMGGTAALEYPAHTGDGPAGVTGKKPRLFQKSRGQIWKCFPRVQVWMLSRSISVSRRSLGHESASRDVPISNGEVIDGDAIEGPVNAG